GRGSSRRAPSRHASGPAGVPKPPPQTPVITLGRSPGRTYRWQRTVAGTATPRSPKMTQPDRIRKRNPMRIEASVTSISWIPSEAIAGLSAKLPFEVGVAHYDQPPPDVVGDLEELRAADRFRFANQLNGWIEVEDGRIVGHGQSGGGKIGSTTLRIGTKEATFQAVALSDLHPAPKVSDTEVTFVQTSGGRIGRLTSPPVRGGPACRT